MYRALYRKWRPKTFSDVVGQDHITKTLVNELKFGRISHAYLFVGLRGTGKTTCAKILSKSVNCLDPQSGDACGKCEICTGIENGNIIDITELDAASNNSVNDIRAICENASFVPAVAKYRVFIIDEVHMLSTGAFAALLKTLEEPPPYVIFILATTEIHKLPATILSRCQRFEFHRISVDTIKQRLLYIASCEGVTLEDTAAFLIARCANGALRDAISLLDKCMSSQKSISEKDAKEILGLISEDYILNIIEGISKKDVSSILNEVNTLYSNSKDMSRLAEEITKAFRDIAITKITKNPSQVLSTTPEEQKKLSEIAENFTLPEVISNLDAIQKAINVFSAQSDPRMELEIALIKMCNKEIIVRENKKEVESHKNIKEPSVSKNSVLKTNVFKNQDRPVFMDDWKKVITKLGEYSKTMSVAFGDSIAYAQGDTIYIDAPKKVAFELLQKSLHRDHLRTAIEDVTGISYKIEKYEPQDTERGMKNLKDLVKNAESEGIPVTEIN